VLSGEKIRRTTLKNGNTSKRLTWGGSGDGELKESYTPVLVSERWIANGQDDERKRAAVNHGGKKPSSSGISGAKQRLIRSGRAAVLGVLLWIKERGKNP